MHLASIGHAVIGDRAYGRAPTPPAGCDEALRTMLQGLRHQALHAHLIAFPHPSDGHEVVVQSPLPADLAVLLDLLERDADAHHLAR